MHVGQVSSLKSEEGQGAGMVDKVTTAQRCLFLLILLSFVCAKPLGVRLCTRIASLSPGGLYFRTESLEELTWSKAAVFYL